MLFSFVSFSSAASYAACSSPAGIEGKIIYNTTHKTAQFCDGTDWWSMKSGGAASGGGGPTGVQVFNTSGTWTKPAGVTKIIIKVQGGGGGGGGSTNSEAGSGGGGGGYCEEFIDVTAIASETVTVGGGGPGGSSSGSHGTNGGLSSFGAHCTGNGGSKGLYSTSDDLGGVGGTATGGVINIPGQRGARSESNDYESHPIGGDAFMGPGSQFTDPANSSDDAGNYGGGGSGGLNQKVGGNGGNGVVIVWEY